MKARRRYCPICRDWKEDKVDPEDRRLGEDRFCVTCGYLFNYWHNRPARKNDEDGSYDENRR